MNPLFNLWEKGFTIFVWMYFTSALFCESLFISPDPRALAPAEANPYDPIFSKVQLVIYGVTFLLVLLRWRTSLNVLLRHPLIVGMLGLVLASCLWSDVPDDSWRKGLNAMATSLFGVYTASRYSLKEQLKYLTIALGIVSIFCLLFTLAAPGAAIEIGANAGSWRGPLTQKNLLARLMVLTIMISLMAVWTIPRLQLFSWIACAVSTLVLVFTGSKTGLIVLAVMLVLLPLYRALRYKDTLMIPILIATVLVVGTTVSLIIGNWESLLLGLGRDPSLSGRTDLWLGAIDKITERPWLGYGFKAFWRDEGGATEIWKIVGYEPPHAHNGYLNMSLDLGLVGLALFLLSMLVAYVRSIQWLRLRPGVLSLMPILYVTFMFMYNHSENTIVSHNSIFWAEFVAISLSML